MLSLIRILTDYDQLLWPTTRLSERASRRRFFGLMLYEVVMISVV
jgi:hypothetical protein